MPTIERHRALNAVLIELSRGLLPYLDEVGVWSSSSTAAHVLQGLAERQRGDAWRIAAWLQLRGWTIDPGGYPSDYADWHFVSFDYLLPTLVAGQRQLLVMLQQTHDGLRSDPSAQTLIEEILASQTVVLQALEEFVATRSSIAKVPGAR